MPSIPESHKRNIFKYRTGQIWNKNIAFKRRMPYMPGQPIARDTRCPLCRGDDSQGHIFGSCMHPDMSKQYIARHDKAMRMSLVSVPYMYRNMRSDRLQRRFFKSVSCSKKSVLWLWGESSGCLQMARPTDKRLFCSKPNVGLQPIWRVSRGFNIMLLMSKQPDENRCTKKHPIQLLQRMEISRKLCRQLAGRFWKRRHSSEKKLLRNCYVMISVQSPLKVSNTSMAGLSFIFCISQNVGAISLRIIHHFWLTTFLPFDTLHSNCGQGNQRNNCWVIQSLH